jgi:hypothetical protein
VDIVGNVLPQLAVRRRRARGSGERVGGGVGAPDDLVSLAIVKLLLAVVCNVQPLLAVDELCTAALWVVEAMT